MIHNHPVSLHENAQFVIPYDNSLTLLHVKKSFCELVVMILCLFLRTLLFDCRCLPPMFLVLQLLGIFSDVILCSLIAGVCLWCSLFFDCRCLPLMFFVLRLPLFFSDLLPCSWISGVLLWCAPLFFKFLCSSLLCCFFFLIAGVLSHMLFYFWCSFCMFAVFPLHPYSCFPLGHYGRYIKGEF